MLPEFAGFWARRDNVKQEVFHIGRFLTLSCIISLALASIVHAMIGAETLVTEAVR
jgi:hypothetical protein